MFADICHAIKDITVPQFAVGIQRMTRSESNILFNCWNGQKLGLRHSPGPRHHQRQQPGADPPFPHRPRCPSSIHSHPSASTCLLLGLQRGLSTSTLTLAAQGRKSLPRPAVTLTCYCSPSRSSDSARVERGSFMPLVWHIHHQVRATLHASSLRMTYMPWSLYMQTCMHRTYAHVRVLTCRVSTHWHGSLYIHTRTHRSAQANACTRKVWQELGGMQISPCCTARQSPGAQVGRWM
jgi:hypothetical protein